MRGLLGAVFVVLILTSFDGGHATRYLPSIVWDHMNPMLSCKCNWFHPMTMMEIYDRFDFVCPTPKITVKLLATHSRPADQMNLNIFQRKWKGGNDEEGIKKLKDLMISGEFCDPESNETQRLYQCKNGKDGQGKMIRFARDTNFFKDDIVVFFNNGNDGRESTLSSKEKRCAMALVANVTWQMAKEYDFTYGKNLTDGCDHVNATCEPEEKPLISFLSLPSKAEEDSSLNITASLQKINTTTSQNTSTRTPQRTNKTTTTSQTKTFQSSSKKSYSPSKMIYSEASFSKRSTSESWDRFKYGVLVGLAIALLLNCFIGVIYFFIRSKSKYGKKNGHGVSNNAYQPQTLKRGGGTTL